MDKSEKSSIIGGDWKSQHRSAMVHLACGMYGLTLTLIAVVLSIASVVQKLQLSQHAFISSIFYLQAYQVYIYAVALIFLVYMQIVMFVSGTRRYHDDLDVNGLTNESINSVCDTDTVEKVIKAVLDDVKMQDSPISVDNLGTNVAADLLDHRVPSLKFDAPDVNFYLRIGVIVFGLGAMIQDGFRLAQLQGTGSLNFDCVTISDVIVISLHLTLTFFQAFYIFKSHKIVMLKHKCVVRFGLVHLIATNLAVWVSSTAEQILQDSLNSNQVLNIGEGRNTSTFICSSAAELSRKASTHLSPLTVLFSLVATAILFRMLSFVGKSSINLVSHEDVVSKVTEEEVNSMDCDKAHKGLFAGLIVLVACVVSISCYFVLASKQDKQAERGDRQATHGDQRTSRGETQNYAKFIYFGTEIVLLVISCCTVVVAACRLRKLRFNNWTDGIQPIEAPLLLLALSGIIILEACYLVVALSTLLYFLNQSEGLNLYDINSESQDLAWTAILVIMCAGLVLLHSYMQTYFLFDAMRRSAYSSSQRRYKPGRSAITFLLLCNLSLLIVACLQPHPDPPSTVLLAPFFGPCTWSIVGHITRPMLVYFRFHSIVCLSDVWGRAYKEKAI